ELIGIAEQIASRLIAKKQTIAVAESSTGGLIAASLLAVPGASAYFLGGTGPTGNRYGDAAGHSCMAVAGTETSVITLETGRNDRQANMQEFAKTALGLLLKNLG